MVALLEVKVVLLQLKVALTMLNDSIDLGRPTVWYEPVYTPYNYVVA